MAEEEIKKKAKEANSKEDEEASEEEKEKARKKNEQRVMCYISKQMAPISDTVEVAYSQRKKYRVLPEYIKY